MARITISGMEDDKNTAVGTTTGTNGGNSGAGTGTAAGNKGGSTGGTTATAGGIRYPLFNWNHGNNVNNNATNETKTNEERAQTYLSELKSNYEKALRDEYDYSADKLKKERDEALRENWILQQQEEAAIPERMAAAGINGGTSETTLANLRSRYQGNRNDIRDGYADNLKELSKQNMTKRAENERAVNERWLEYLLSLAETSYANRFA